jgi:hypothetical protein
MIEETEGFPRQDVVGGAPLCCLSHLYNIDQISQVPWAFPPDLPIVLTLMRSIKLFQALQSCMGGTSVQVDFIPSLVSTMFANMLSLGIILHECPPYLQGGMLPHVSD